MESLPEEVTEGQKELINDMFDWLIPPVFVFIKKKCKFIVPTSDLHLFQVNIYEGFQGKVELLQFQFYDS